MRKNRQVLVFLTLILFSISHFTELTVWAKSDHLTLTGARKSEQHRRVTNRDWDQASNQRQINLLLIAPTVTMATSVCSCNFVGMGVSLTMFLALSEWEERNSREFCNGGCGYLMSASDIDSTHKASCNKYGHDAHEWWSCWEGSTCPHASSHIQTYTCDIAIPFPPYGALFGCGEEYLDHQAKYHTTQYCDYCFQVYRECSPPSCTGSSSGHSSPPVVPTPPEARSIN